MFQMPWSVIMGIISFLTKLVNRKRRRKNLQNAQISRRRNSRALPYGTHG